MKVVSAHQLVTTYDCRTWSCSGQAPRPGGLCPYCAKLAEVHRHALALAWRRATRAVDPPAGAGCSPLSFQAVASALAEALADRVDNGSPSVAEIAAACRASERTVQAALAALEKLELIQRDTRGGRGRATRYRLRRPARPREPSRIRAASRPHAESIE